MTPWFKSAVIIFIVVFSTKCTQLSTPDDANNGKKTQTSPSVVEPKTNSVVQNSPKTNPRSKIANKKLADKKAGTKQHTPRKLPDVVDIGPGNIIFFRSSVVASAVSAQLYEVSQGRPKLVAQATNNTQVHHSVLPGHHTFMLVSGDSVDYVSVNVVSNRDYFVLIKPSMGAWKPSFSFFPIKARRNNSDEDIDGIYYFGDEEVEQLLTFEPAVVKSKKAESIANDESLFHQFEKSWAKWSRLSPSDKYSKTLDALDGR